MSKSLGCLDCNCSRVIAERDTLAKELAEVRGQLLDAGYALSMCEQSLDAWKGAANAAVAALRKYGQHTPGLCCTQGCVCGLDAALEAVGGDAS